MKIREVMNQTGLTEKTIRFYVEKGLVSPAGYESNGREYREYSPDDVRQLQQVADLRRAYFSIGDILLMKESPERIPEVLDRWCAEQRQEAGT